jgi:outer membrane protein
MMSKIRQSGYMHLVTATVLLLLISLDSTAADLKIGYVNTVKVIEQAPQAKSALKRLEKEFAPRDKKLVDKRERIKNIETELEKNSLVLNDSERRGKERELLGLKRDVRRATQEFREDYNLRRNEELAALQKLVYKTIVDLAKKQKFDLILHEGTVYASEQIDITERVLENLRKKFNRQ